ncbi:MAG: ABC transporter permease [Nannocystaceae bacterium]
MARGEHQGRGRRALGRLGAAALTLALVVVIVFGVVDALADPAALALGPTASPDEVARLRGAWGLDRPFLTRLGELFLRLARLDLGESLIQRIPVSTLIARAAGPTLAYALPGTLLAGLVGVAGGLAAARRGGAIDRLVHALGALLVSTSSVVLVIGASELLAHRLGLFPILGWPLAGSSRSPSELLALPILLWALLQLGPDLRHYRAIFVRELAAPHLDGLRARGIGEAKLLVHVLRGAIGPILARLAARLPHLLVGSLVLEVAFGIPGLGALAVSALRRGDLAVLEGIALCTAAVTIVGQHLLAFGAGAVDPRLREGPR